MNETDAERTLEELRQRLCGSYDCELMALSLAFVYIDPPRKVSARENEIRLKAPAPGIMHAWRRLNTQVPPSSSRLWKRRSEARYQATPPAAGEVLCEAYERAAICEIERVVREVRSQRLVSGWQGVAKYGTRLFQLGVHVRRRS